MNTHPTIHTMPNPSPTPSWTIHPVPPHSSNELITFINNARRTTFPGRSLAPDTSTTLFGHGGSYFLAARAEKELIGAIGFVAYNHRFAQFDYRSVRTAEVVRLHVEPGYRRCGVATALFEALCERARDEGVECLYLHTHPFLPGALAFWERCGFEIVLVERDLEWRTTHMQMMVREMGKGLA
jgi:GNAT superfamily N-acetyltransferase